MWLTAVVFWSLPCVKLWRCQNFKIMIFFPIKVWNSSFSASLKNWKNLATTGTCFLTWGSQTNNMLDAGFEGIKRVMCWGCSSVVECFQALERPWLQCQHHIRKVYRNAVIPVTWLELPLLETDTAVVSSSFSHVLGFFHVLQLTAFLGVWICNPWLAKALNRSFKRKAKIVSLLEDLIIGKIIVTCV